jgi:hypothetical protein
MPEQPLLLTVMRKPSASSVQMDFSTDTARSVKVSMAGLR